MAGIKQISRLLQGKMSTILTWHSPVISQNLQMNFYHYFKSAICKSVCKYTPCVHPWIMDASSLVLFNQLKLQLTFLDIMHFSVVLFPTSGCLHNDFKLYFNFSLNCSLIETISEWKISKYSSFEICIYYRPQLMKVETVKHSHRKAKTLAQLLTMCAPSLLMVHVSLCTYMCIYVQKKKERMREST